MSNECVTINGTNYITTELPEAAKTQVVNIQVADMEISRLQQKLAIAQTARNAYAAALLDAVKVKDAAELEVKPKKPRTPRKPKAL